jgi:hypothetical protein
MRNAAAEATTAMTADAATSGRFHTIPGARSSAAMPV